MTTSRPAPRWPCPGAGRCRLHTLGVDRRGRRAGPADEGPRGSREGGRAGPGEARQPGLHRQGPRAVVAKIRDRLATAEADLVRIDAALETLPSVTDPRIRRRRAELNARGFTLTVFELDRIEALLDLLGSPQRAYPVIQIAGTNGKTSTARMIDSLLGRSGCTPAGSPARTCRRSRADQPGRRADQRGAVRRRLHRHRAATSSWSTQRGRTEPLSKFEILTAHGVCHVRRRSRSTSRWSRWGSAGPGTPPT